MSLGEEFKRFTPEAAKALAVAKPDTWSALRADLEFWLLDLIRDGGLEELNRAVARLNELGFRFREESKSGSLRTFVSPLPGTETSVRIAGSSTAGDISADVTFPDPTTPLERPDPRHVRFCAAYEGMWGLADEQVARLDGQNRAILLVGLLEAELNNGGIGQYLTNTEGAHLAATIEVLRGIDAPHTRRVLEEASRLMNARGVTPGEAWTALASELAELDGRFFDAGEDLSGAVMDVFEPGAGSTDPPAPPGPGDPPAPPGPENPPSPSG